MRVVLLRPPRYVWPFNSETSAFWQPLGLLCLAAAARRDLPGVKVEVWDCPGERCGWASLQRRLASEPIDVLGVGEETVSAHEALRAAGIVRQLWPSCRIVAGGTYFAYTIEPTLATGLVDVIVRGEGEATFVELLRNLPADRAETGAMPGAVAGEVPQGRSSHANAARRLHSLVSTDWAAIKGIAYLDGDGRVVVTPPRPLIEDLDSLPEPAYDLLDMSNYGRSSRNHPALVSVEHSRGCVDTCDFCILWKHMGQDDGLACRPRYRTQSPQRSFELVRRLYRNFGRRTFGWVDPTFNASPQWSDAWAELMLAGDLAGPAGRPRTIHTAWMRADCVVRDHKLGVLAKLVRAGLRQVMIGVERQDDAGLSQLGKHNNSSEVCREAFAILHRHHPQVFTIGTMIYGLPGDTRQDLDRLMAAEYEQDMDWGFLMPLTPNPGTAAAQRAERGGYVAGGELASYNFHTPVCRTDTLSLRQLESVYWRMMLSPRPRRLGRFLRLLTCGDRRKRHVSMALVQRGTMIALRSLLRALLHPKDDRPTLYSRKPSWYDH